MALKAGYKGIKKFIADKLNSLSDVDNLATDAEVAAQIATLDESKCDNTVIAPVEDGDKFTQAYTAGQHVIHGGKFCTLKSNVTTSDTPSASNLDDGTVASALVPIMLTDTATAEDAPSITLPSTYHIAFIFIQNGTDKTVNMVHVNGLSSRSIRFGYKTAASSECRGYVWYSSTTHNFSLGAFVIDGVEMYKDPNTVMTIYYI